MDLTNHFISTYQHEPAVLVRAPGRVNLLGEHVDYNDGIVLPAAIDREMWLAVGPRQDGCVSLAALDLSEQVTFRLSEIETRRDIAGNPLPHWALYPAGIAWALKQAGYIPQGIEAVYTSNIPIGSGLSSSAAVQVAFSVAWQELNGWNMDRLRLAQICQRAENAYLSIASGLMDQFASANGVLGHCLKFDTRSLEWEPVPLPKGTTLVIADSSVRRTLAGSAYNERRASCEEAVHLLKQYLPNIQSLRDVKPTEFAAYSAYLPEVPRKRADHIVHEIARVESAVTALKTGRTRSFGALMFAGHASLRDLYEVSIPELDALVEIARGLTGVLGARLTGAGFGGCTVNLVEEQHTDEFVKQLTTGYHKQTGRTAQVYVCQASDGASARRA